MARRSSPLVAAHALSSLVLVSFLLRSAAACTSFIVTPAASADGSTQISYAADNSQIYGEALRVAAADYEKGSVMSVMDMDTGRYLGVIPQAEHTYAYIGGAQMGGINERQVGLAETTFGGLPSLQAQPGALVDYAMLMQLGLQRASTAREAIDIITTHMAQYGYASEGESFTIADTREVWVMDIIGKGAGELGAVWVAMRVPDGHISGHANQARITTFPRDDPDTCLYAPDVVSFAVANGFYPAGAPEADFDFAATYNPITFSGARASDARVWDFFSRVGGEPGFAAAHAAYATGADLSVRLPFSIKPAAPVALNDTLWATRSKYENTPLDMTKDVAAGGYESPFRAHPLFWDATGKPDATGTLGNYFHERPAATQQTGWHFVAQLRAWLPHEVGGLLWYGVDDTSLSPRTPIHVGVTELPPSYTSTPLGKGSFADATTFSLDSAWWVNNLVANYAYWQYNLIAPQVHTAIAMHEASAFAELAAIETTATTLLRSGTDVDRDAAIKLLTGHCVSAGQRLTVTWLKLFHQLFVQHRDGTLNSRVRLQPSAKAGDGCPCPSIAPPPDGQCTAIGKPGYASWWYGEIVAYTGARFAVTQPRSKAAATTLIASASPAEESVHVTAQAQRILERGSAREGALGSAHAAFSPADAWIAASAAAAREAAGAADATPSVLMMAAHEAPPPKLLRDRPSQLTMAWPLLVGLFVCGVACGALVTRAHAAQHGRQLQLQGSRSCVTAVPEVDGHQELGAATDYRPLGEADAAAPEMRDQEELGAATDYRPLGEVGASAFAVLYGL